MTDRLCSQHRFLLRRTYTRALERAARLAHQLVGAAPDTPLDALVWAELAPDRALRRIAQQAATRSVAAAAHRPSR